MAVGSLPSAAMLLPSISRRLAAPGGAPSWLVRVLTTLAAWLVAFVVVTTLLTVFGDQLRSLPLALRALVLSGVLVTLMANVAMPLLSSALARWQASAAGTNVPWVDAGEQKALAERAGAVRKLAAHEVALPRPAVRPDSDTPTMGGEHR
jgi:hypothetical protein